MTLDAVIDILEENPTVDGHDIKDNGVRFWVGTRAYKGDQQDVVENLRELDGVDLNDEGVENDWRWYFATISDS